MLPRKRIFIGALMAALLFIFPLRVALGMANAPIQAAFVGGFVWSGRLVDARIAGLPLGDLAAGLSPLDLLIGRVKFWVKGRFEGALVSGFTGSGADVKALLLPVTRRLGAVTLTQVELSDARIRFSGNACSEANGRLQLIFAPSPITAGQAARFTGDLRCDGDALAATMASQSAMERLALRVDHTGGYTVTLTIRAQNEAMAQTLRAGGFRETQAGFAVRAKGAL